MHTVRSILERKPRGEVVSIAEDATVLDASKVMNEHRIGALVVTRDDKVVGIFTERDVLNRVVAMQKIPASVTVGDVMTAPVAVCSPDTSRAECRTVMRGKRIRHLPVVEDDALIGMISIGDLTEDAEAEQDETIRYLYEYMVGEWAPQSL